MRLCLAGARGIEPRSQVLETYVLTVVLCPSALRIITDTGHMVVALQLKLGATTQRFGLTDVSQY